MSRYVRVTLTQASRRELQHALEALGLPIETGTKKVMLRGSLECAGEPVDVCVRAGALGTVEDFGFLVEAERLRLVCGELDRGLLERELLGGLQRAIAEARVTEAANEAGMEIERVEGGVDGSRRVVLRRK